MLPPPPPLPLPCRLARPLPCPRDAEEEEEDDLDLDLDALPCVLPPTFDAFDAVDRLAASGRDLIVL